jgi:CspA family cold shock protein
MGEADVAMGTAKWFDPKKGYGFVIPDGGGKDVFVLIKTVQKAGYTNLVEGARVSYELMSDRSGRMSAAHRVVRVACGRRHLNLLPSGYFLLSQSDGCR